MLLWEGRRCMDMDNTQGQAFFLKYLNFYHMVGAFC